MWPSESLKSHEIPVPVTGERGLLGAGALRQLGS